MLWLKREKENYNFTTWFFEKSIWKIVNKIYLSFLKIYKALRTFTKERSCIKDVQNAQQLR
jgi:hypothetical protein